LLRNSAEVVKIGLHLTKLSSIT